MLNDRRLEFAERAMRITETYERARGAGPVRTDHGYDPLVQKAVRGRWNEQLGPPSADLVSIDPHETRVIEVKTRSLVGPITILERQKHTFEALRDVAWLYVIWNVRQRAGDPRERLVLVQDPGRLSWTVAREASRPVGAYRGVQHEATFTCAAEEIDNLGRDGDLTGITES